MLEQTINLPEDAELKKLEMTRDEEKDVVFLRRCFKYALRLRGFSEETVQNLTVNVEKASLSNSDVKNDFADGQPFFRMKIDSGTTLYKPNEALKTLLMISQILGEMSDATLQTGNPVTMTHDFRDALLTKATQLTHIVHVTGPYIVKPAPKGPNPLSP